jgi:hypothetical protein
MAKTRDKSAVVNGVLYPSSKDIKAIVTSLQRKVAEDPNMAKLFKKDPRRTLATLGLNEDVQSELLREMNIKLTRALLSWCICTECCKTCWCTACCITDINITNRLERP